MREKAWKRYDNKKTPFTEEEIKDIIEKKYHDCLPNTKKYIATGLKTIGPKFKANICIMVKEDFINIFNEAFNSLGKYRFDFSRVPDIIKNTHERITIICKETICGVEIGEFTVTRNSITKGELNPLSKFEKFLLKDLQENVETKNKYLPLLEEKFQGVFDFSESKFVSTEIPLKYKCISCGQTYWDNIINLLYYRKAECKNCASIQREKEYIEEAGKKWLEEAKTLHSNNCDYTNAVYRGHNKTVTGLKCKLCENTFEQKPDSHLQSPYGCCYECAKKLAGAKSRSNIENVKARVEEIHGVGTFNWEKAVYVTNQTPITLIDVATGIEFQSTPNRLMSIGEGLPFTHKHSLGERNTVKWLEANKIAYISEKFYPTTEIQGKGERGVRIDFEIEIKDKKIWIECNGKQHYEYCPIFYRWLEYYSEESKELYRKQLSRDANVRNYSKEHDILLVEIPYTSYAYDKIDDILTRIILNNESPDFIEIPEIKYC